MDIEYTDGQRKHLYVSDSTTKAEGRIYHVSKRGNTTLCERT